MKITRFVVAMGLLAGGATTAFATNLGFGQLGGNNTTVPANYGSNATANSSGVDVSYGGPTPGISLVWDANWDIHTSSWFSSLEDQFVGGGAWDNEGNMPRIGQLDFGLHTIRFNAQPDVKLVLSSFDFGLTGETANTTTSWKLTLTQVSTSAVVWNQSVAFTVVGNNADTQVISPSFTGLAGEDYILTFERISESFPSDGRHGIDNLQFSQVVVPEPATYGVVFAGLLGLIALRRRKARA
jgi:PEP-CTERM putative exosortase interaction domain